MSFGSPLKPTKENPKITYTDTNRQNVLSPLKGHGKDYSCFFSSVRTFSFTWGARHDRVLPLQDTSTYRYCKPMDAMPTWDRPGLRAEH